METDTDACFVVQSDRVQSSKRINEGIQSYGVLLKGCFGLTMISYEQCLGCETSKKRMGFPKREGHRPIC